MFRFRKEIREFVRSAADLIHLANAKGSVGWACQSDGVYGAAYLVVTRIVREECGRQVLDKINQSRHGFNFGGNTDFLEDAEQAVQDAIESLLEDAAAAEEERRDRLDEEDRLAYLADGTGNAVHPNCPGCPGCM